MENQELDDNLNIFLRHLDAIKDTLPMIILLLQPFRKKANTKFEEFMEEHVESIQDDNDEGNISISLRHDISTIYEELSKNAETANLATLIIPESLFVSLISQYDAFLNRLLKSLYTIRPEYINSSERELTYSQLVNFMSLEDAREYIIDKEIETVLRKSHSEHFDYLESKLKITLKKNLPIWQTFIEITERRNLLVHCDGKVSNQYLKVCGEHNCTLDEVKLNQKLRVSIDYFNEAYECLYELATKLTHTIWRKLLKDQLEEADEKLNKLCYNLIMSKQYNLADILLDFSYNQVKHFNDSSKNYFVVNKALSKFMQNNKAEAKKIINMKDWSASSDDFKLAYVILNEDTDKIYPLMKKIGKNGDVEMEHYRTWPLFYHLRNEEKFKNTFQEIFGQEYTVLEIPQKPIADLFQEIKKTQTQKTTKKAVSKKTQNQSITNEKTAISTKKPLKKNLNT